MKSQSLTLPMKGFSLVHVYKLKEICVYKWRFMGRKNLHLLYFLSKLVKSLLGRVVVGILPTTFPLQEPWPILKAALKSMLM